MSIVFIGTPEFAVPSLKALVDTGPDIAAVVTQPDRPAGRGRTLTPSSVKAAATEHGLTVLQPASLRDPEAVEQLRKLAPEVMVAVAYGQILRREVLEIPPKGVLNVHPSLLPRWRGATPIPAAILAGDNETGVSIMLMDQGMDSGPILAQQTTRLSDSETTATLTASLAEVGASLLAHTLPRWLNGEITPRPQNEEVATVCHPLTKGDGAIDWTRPATEIWRQVRAYDPWPGAFTPFDGESLRIWSAWPIEAVPSSEAVGTILGIPEDAPLEAQDAAFAVQTGDGVLAIHEVQRAGRNRLSSKEFLRGSPGLIGTVLG